MSEYDVLINKYNALNAGYDQLYPKPMKHANTHTSGGTDPITPSDIGAYSKNETDALLQNKAEAGFGFGGETLSNITVSDASESYESFCAKVDAVLATMRDSSVKMILAYPPEMYGYGQSSCILYKGNNDYAGLYSVSSYNEALFGFRMIKCKIYSSDPTGKWQPFEWVNPPLTIGKEYRTTERYLGKPVYVRLHDFGALPNNTAKTDNSPANWSIDQAICAYGTTVAGTIPSQNFGGLLVAGRSISLYFNTGSITVATDYDRSSLSATIFLKYTKTTD